MRSLFVGCVASACFALHAEQALAQNDAAKGENWAERAKQTRVGMTRREVERLLPRYVRSEHEPRANMLDGVITLGTGGMQCQIYFVAPGWRVHAVYDYSGLPRRAEGTSIPPDKRHPDNRLLKPVEIERLPTFVAPD